MTPKASDLAARLAASAAGAPAALPAVSPATEVEHTVESTARAIQRFMVILPKSQHIIRALLSRIETDPVFAEEVRNLVTEGH